MGKSSISIVTLDFKAMKCVKGSFNRNNLFQRPKIMVNHCMKSFEGNRD